MTMDLTQATRSGPPLQGAYGNYALNKIKTGDKLTKASPAQMQKINAAAEDFEADFLSQMMGNMFEGVQTDPMFGGGESEDIYRSMMIDEYGKMISKAGGIGLADHVKRQLLTLQEME